MRILIVDDHQLMRDGLKHLIKRQFSNAEIAEATDAASAMDKLGICRWNAILLDIDLPDRSGVDLLTDILALAPESPILVLSGHGEQQFEQRERSPPFADASLR